MLWKNNRIISTKEDAETAQKALDQISARGYAAPYQTDGRRMVKVGVSADEHTVEERAVENDK